jgi:hypothetical protein
MSDPSRAAPHRPLRDPELEAALRRVTNQTLAGLVEAALEQARAPYRAAGALLSSPDPDVADRAGAAFDEARELALAPLMEVAGLSAEGRGWQLASVAEVAVELRRDVLRWLLEALRDRREATAGPPAARVCDEAYLLLGTVLPLPERHPARTLDRQTLLALPVWRRDTLQREAERAPFVRRALGEHP